MTSSNNLPAWSGALACLASLALALSVSVHAEAATNPRPNILLVIADDMGLDASSCYKLGSNQASMPNLEKLCAAGMVFENAYAYPTCTPTRASIMTGRYGFRTGVGAAIARQGGTGLSADETSLFDVLEGAGYGAALIGKWHLSASPSDLNHPAELGVKTYYGMFSGAVRDYYRWDGVENGKPTSVSRYATVDLTDRAIAWTAAQTSPWFLWLAYNAPHAPFHVPPGELLRGAGELQGGEAAIRKNPLPYFNAALQALDSELGRLLDALPNEVRRNTVVMFIGDNGTPGQVAASLWGNRRAKGSIFDGGTHVPFVVQGPGVAIGRVRTLVNSTDLHATIAALAGAAAPKAVDAVNLVPVLQGGPGSREFAYVEHFSNHGGTPPDVYGWAIRDERHKLVAEDGQAHKLFDLMADPLEKSDLLAGDASAEARAVAAKLVRAHQAIRQ